MPKSKQLAVLALRAAIFFSGACGLGQQMVWTRKFGIGLGHELPAVLAVVTAFFGGIALGAMLLDRSIGQSPRPGRWFGILEIIIGVWGITLIGFLPVANDLALAWIGQSPSTFRHGLAAFLVPFAALLPATMAMGATLPAMEGFVAPFSKDRKCVGILYALNTLGAVAGVLVTTLFVGPALGFNRALLSLAAVNLLIGAVILIVESALLEVGANALDRASPSRRAASERTQRTRLAGTDSPDLAVHGEKCRASTDWAISSRRLNLILFFTGLLGIGFEILGVRVLSEVLENTIFTFAASLSVYLLGTAMGAALYQRFGRSIEFRAAVAFLLFGLSVACLIGGFALANARHVFDGSRGAFGDSLGGVIASEMVVAASVFALPTIFMGAAFSHLVQSSRGERGGIGRAIAFNTLGSALAPLVVGVGLLPVLGAKWSLVTLAASYLVTATCAGGAKWIRLALLLPLGLMALLPQRLQFVQPPPGGKVLEYRIGTMESVAVVEHFDRHRSLLVNNRFTMGGTGAADAARRHAHIPLLLHSDPKRALFLGLGTGITLAGAGTHPGLTADGVELVPEIPEVLHYFEPHNRLRPGLRVHVADARRFVRVGDERYDVIVADLFHPARDGAGALYTFEHFQAARSRLNPNGIFCQWLPLYQLGEEMLQVVVRTFLEVFPHSHAWLLRFNVDTPVLGLIAFQTPPSFSPDWLARRVQDVELGKELRTLGLPDALHLFGGYVAGPKRLRDYAKNAPLNTEDAPVVMFRAPEFAFRRREKSYGRLVSMLDLGGNNLPPWIELNGTDAEKKFADELKRFIDARNIYLRGLIAESEGKQARAIDAYLESVRTSEHFTTSYARCLTLAMQNAKTKPEEARLLLQKLAEAQPAKPVAQELLKRLFP